MGMSYYPVDIYGLYLDDKIKEEILTFFKKNRTEDLKDIFGKDEPTKEELIESLTEDDTVCVLYEATCDFEEICGEQKFAEFNAVDEENVYYIPLLKFPSLFDGNGYKDFAEIVSEVKKAVTGLLPDDYHLEDNIVHIYGTLYS